jgi:hypothetical protein
MPVVSTIAMRIDMSNKKFRFLTAIALVTASFAVHAQLPWSEQTHQIAFGDFNGDHRTDVLHIARDSSQSSGIALSTGSGPYATGQTWASNYLGIAWHSATYKPIVGDFNGDGRADILMQRQTAGDHYLLFANAAGQITAITQNIGNTLGGQTWSPDGHRIVAGDFNGDHKTDLFLQSAKVSGLNAIFLAGSSGTFSSAQQTWGNVHIGFQWSATKATVYPGDFDGDGKDDLFIQAKPDIVIIDYEIPFPVPSYRPGSFGIANAKAPNGGGEIFYTPALQIWDRKFQNADWSAMFYDAAVGDFNGDGRDDILLQGRSPGKLNSMFLVSSSGQVSSGDALTDTTIRNATGDVYRIYAVNFAGIPSSAVYMQAVSSGGTSSIAWNGTPTLGSETITYTYDAKGRLTKVVHAGTVNDGVKTCHSLDKAGNRTSVVTTDGTCVP